MESLNRIFFDTKNLEVTRSKLNCPGFDPVTYANDSTLILKAPRRVEYYVNGVYDLNMSPLATALEQFRIGAGEIGLKIHAGKTQLLVANGQQRAARVKFNIDGVDISPSNTIKVLGMDINKEFNVNITQWKRARRARSHLWMLMKAREFFATTRELELIYKCYIRSQMEVNMQLAKEALTGKIINYMESTQRKALKLIFRQNIGAPNWGTGNWRRKPAMARSLTGGLDWQIDFISVL